MDEEERDGEKEKEWMEEEGEKEGCERRNGWSTKGSQRERRRDDGGIKEAL